MRGNINAAVLAALSIISCAAASSGTAATCNLHKWAELPVTMTDFRPLISARINGLEARLFIDTGSYWLTLTPKGAAKFGLHVNHSLESMSVRGVTGEADVGTAHAAEFDLDRFKFHEAGLLVAGHELGAEADGLIGQNLLGTVDVEYDLANGVVRLFDPNNNCTHNDLAYWSRTGGEVMAIDRIERPQTEIRGEAMLNGVKIQVMFDTGTPRSVITLNAARRAGVRMDGEDVESVGFTGGIGSGAVREWLAPFKTFAIGDEQVHDTRLRVADIDIGDADMLLGADFFLSHRMFIAKSQSRIYFTYNGGPVFDFERGAAAAAPGATQPPSAARNAEADDTPKDAAGFVLRGDAFLNRQEFGKAIADYTSAIALHPSDPELYADRGVAYVQDGKPTLALADFDQTLKLHPDTPRALLARGELRLANGNAAGAREDFDAALRLAPDSALAVANLYTQGGFYEDAVNAYDKLLDGKPVTEVLARDFFLRCRARSYWGQQLDKAIADCTEAIKAIPWGPEGWQIRGIDYLRVGNFDAAIADLNSALRLEPRNALSLYARGIAESRKGAKDKGDADTRAAISLDEKVVAQAKRYDIGP